jgi:hypothetical protein
MSRRSATGAPPSGTGAPPSYVTESNTARQELEAGNGLTGSSGSLPNTDTKPGALSEQRAGQLCKWAVDMAGQHGYQLVPMTDAEVEYMVELDAQHGDGRLQSAADNAWFLGGAWLGYPQGREAGQG